MIGATKAAGADVGAGSHFPFEAGSSGSGSGRKHRATSASSLGSSTSSGTSSGSGSGSRLREHLTQSQLCIAVARNPHFQEFLITQCQMSPQLVQGLVTWADVQGLLMRTDGPTRGSEVSFKPPLVKKLMDFVHGLIGWSAHRASYHSMGMPPSLVPLLRSEMQQQQYEKQQYEKQQQKQQMMARSSAAVTASEVAQDADAAMATSNGTGTGTATATASGAFAPSAPGATAPTTSSAPSKIILTIERCVAGMVEGVPPYDLGAEGDAEESGADQHDTDGDAAGAGEDVVDEDSDEAETLPNAANLGFAIAP